MRDELERELQALRLEHERKVADLKQVSNAEIFELNSKLAEKQKEIHVKLDGTNQELVRIMQTEKLEKELDELRSKMATKDSDLLSVREELSRSLTLVTLLQDQLKTANQEVAKTKNSEESTLKELDVLRIENEALLKGQSGPRIKTPVDGNFVRIPGNVELLPGQVQIDASIDNAYILKVRQLEAELEKHRLEVSERKSLHDLERCSLQSELEIAKKSCESLQERFDLKSLELKQLRDSIVKQENLDANTVHDIERVLADYRIKYEALLELYKAEQVILRYIYDKSGIIIL